MKHSPSENNKFTPHNRGNWREWLHANHKSSNEIWLVYYKKHTGRPTISYNDSVEEAICFGWIDGIKIRIDNESYSHRFTPRRARSNWSETNVKRARLMINKGLMAPSGLKIFKEATNNTGRIISRSNTSFSSETPQDLSRALKKEDDALNNFASSPPSYKKMCIAWINSAKNDKTRQRRIKEVVWKAASGERIGLR